MEESGMKLSEDEHEQLQSDLKLIANMFMDEQISINQYDEMYEASRHDGINYGHKQIEIGAFYLEYAIRMINKSNETFSMKHTNDRPDKERKNYNPDFINSFTKHYIDAKMHYDTDSTAILNDAHAMRTIIENDGYIDILVAEASYTPDDGTYRVYREIRNGGKSKYQQKNANSRHRMIRAASEVHQIAVYRINEKMINNPKIISIMKQGKNSNGKPRNEKFVLNLSAVVPITAIRKEKSDDGTVTWNECDGLFDPSLCGKREPSEKLLEKNSKIRTMMKISPEKIKAIKQVQRKVHRYKKEGGSTFIWVDSYTKSDGTKVSVYWRTSTSSSQ